MRPEGSQRVARALSTRLIRDRIVPAPFGSLCLGLRPTVRPVARSGAYRPHTAHTSQAGGCVGSIPRGGCTVEAALTFDSLATFYVGSACVYPVYGCTLAGYGNYNPAARHDWSSTVAFGW